MAGENLERARRFYPSERLDIAEVFRRDDAVELLESQVGDMSRVELHTGVDAAERAAGLEKG